MTFANGALQNGADAAALNIGNSTDFPNDTAITTDDLLDAIVYDNGQADNAVLLVLLNLGQPQVNETSSGNGTTVSLQRCANGTGGQRNTSTFGQFSPSPGTDDSLIVTVTSNMSINANFAVFLPEIDVQRSAGTSITDGSSDALGNKLAGTVALTYTIDNSAGTDTLTIPAGGVTISNSVNVSNYTLNTALPLNVPAGSTATLSRSFDVDAVGDFSFDLNIVSNDGDENLYNIAVSDTGVSNFSDVSETYWAYSCIKTIYDSGITSGCYRGVEFCPNNPVTRAQVAILILRAKNGNKYVPPKGTGTIFGDVPSTYWAVDRAEQLAIEGITSGCSSSPKLFCLNDLTTRAQIAILILRAKHGSSYTPPVAQGNLFNDVSVTTWGAAWIEQLYKEGITSGCGSGNYCPNRPVTRAEIAIFLTRAFNLTMP